MTELRQDRLEQDPQTLSEAELRQLYDEEEVERFMSLFSAYVTEIRLSNNTTSTEHSVDDGLDSVTRETDRSLSERIAHDYLLPHLPPAGGATPPFTLKRFTLAIQRLYLSMCPTYQAYLSNLAQLALWKNHQRSLRYCLIFWFLWFHDLLLPAVVFRIMFSLLRRRLSTNPTVKELRERRKEAARALKFGEAIQQQLSVTTIGPIEIWRLFKSYKSEVKDKEKSPTIETDEEENLKHVMLFVLNELADLHERIKNIFTWRRPDVSRRYLFFLAVIGFGTLALPAQCIAKLIYWCGGILFWHVTPVIAALPREDRTRASVLFGDAPTDADYAMELIAKRIATGQEVDVSSLRNRSRHTSNASTNTEILMPTSQSTLRDALSSENDGINWKKWGERVARGKLFIEEGRRCLSTHHQATGETTDKYMGRTEDAHTFLAQYASSPGLISLTPSTLLFTSFTETRARLVVPRDRLRAVKRSGLVKGISITWTLEEVGEREDKFYWVGNRDELFARLVGSDGGRWMTV